MKYINIFIIYCIITFTFLISILFASANNETQISADKITFNEKDQIVTAEGNVIIENNNIKAESNNIEYFKDKNMFKASNSVRIKDKYENNYFTENLVSDTDFSNSSASNIKIRLKDESRIVGNKFIRKKNINTIFNGQYTPCNEKNYLIKNCPGWKLKAKKVFHDEESKTIHYDHSILYILNVPVLYTPYFSHPDPTVKKRSGLLAPSIKSDDKLGQSISLPYFYNINNNKDLTFTPTLQSTGTNYITSEFRLLNKNGLFNIIGNINDNDDKIGTKHYLFADAEIHNQLGEIDVYMQNSNSDTYMKRNQINELDFLTSGINISNTINGNDFSFEAKAYKHLAVLDDNQWEYLYPKFSYNIFNLKVPFLDENIDLKNEVLRTKNLDKEIVTSISSEANINQQKINLRNGLVFNNFFDNRVIYHSLESDNSKNDLNQIRIFPQIGSKISMPLTKNTTNTSQILKPILMPIFAPYNNYTEALEVSNSNIFSKNRSSILSKWESGPRINYGAEWFIDYKNKYDGNLIIGQSIRFNKEKNDTSDEISDIMTSMSINFNKNRYANAEFIIDREHYYINKSNITSSIYFKDFAFKAEYDYVSNRFAAGSEQLGLATKFKLNRDLNFIFSGKRDLNSKINIGYETGLFYENDCLAIDFKYYRDLTKFKDIEDTRGLSFLITLKPFGSSKSFGKSKTFGPQI